jgi:hypothetical protein
VKLIRCDYCKKELDIDDPSVYTVSRPLLIFGYWYGDKHFCSSYCISEDFYIKYKEEQEDKE